MTPNQEKIKSYIYKITKGLVNLKQEHLEMIIKLAVSKDDGYAAVLFRKDYQKDIWEKIRTVKTSKDEVDEAIKKNGTGSNGFYRWDIYNPADECVNQIFSINSQLF